MWRPVRVAFIGTDTWPPPGAGRCAKALRPEGGEYVAFVNRTETPVEHPVAGNGPGMAQADPWT